MDRIDNCISKNLHITKNPTIIGKTWKDFNMERSNKKVILYGLGILTNFLWMRCEGYVEIVAAIDNDKEMQGHTLGEFFDEDDLKSSKNVKISSKDVLKEYSPDEVVVLISSQRYYEEIASDLDVKKFHCYFSILNLEYHYREYMKKNNLSFDTEYTYMRNYAKKCVEKYPIQKNKIVISVEAYADHAKIITEKLLSLNKNLDIVWVMDKITLNVPNGVRIVYIKRWKQYIYEMETAKIWVYNIYVLTFLLIKRENQIYIQTKHWGSITLKTFSLDNVKNKNNTENFVLNGQWMDYIISGSKFDEDSCRSAFNFKGKFLRFGSPRSDILFSSAKKCREKVFKKYNINPDEKVLIYAPTFRLDKKKGYFDLIWQNLDFEMLLNSLQNKWSNTTWKIFLRLHPAIKSRANQIKKTNYVVDVSEYEDSQELVAASDIMLSDFSSIIFESAYIMRPVFLYAPDKETYQKDDRELLLDYDSLPFPISTTNEELSEQIKNFDEKIYKENVRAFLDKYDVHEDGHASERTAKFILELIGE